MNNSIESIYELKRHLLSKGIKEYKSLESTIVQVLSDELGEQNEIAKKARDIKAGYIVPSAFSFINGISTEDQYNKEQYKLYVDLLDEAQSFLMLFDRKDSTEKPIEVDDMCIFLSYSWSDSDIVDRIDQFLSSQEINVRRDIRDIGNWESIKIYMKSIRFQDYAILIISDNFLRSRNCMYEVFEIMKDEYYLNKIFPVVLERKIYEPLGRIEYIQYWENETQRLEKAIDTIDVSNAAELAKELRKMKQIQSTIGEFLDHVSDMNNPDIGSINDAISEKIGIHKQKIEMVEQKISSKAEEYIKNDYQGRKKILEQYANCNDDYPEMEEVSLLLEEIKRHETNSLLLSLIDKAMESVEESLIILAEELWQDSGSSID